MSSSGVGFPVPGWFIGLPICGEYGQRIADYETFCRQHVEEIVFTHDLWLKGNGSGGMEGMAGAYRVGQATFLEAPMPDKAKNFLNGCFWLGDRESVHYRDVPSDLLVVPTVVTIIRALGKVLRDAGYVVVEREFVQGEFPEGKQTAWIMNDAERDQVIVQLEHEAVDVDDASEDDNPVEVLLLDNQFYYSFDEEDNWYVLSRSILAGKFLEESFPDS